MKVLNVGTMEPVMVVLGDVSLPQIKQLDGILLGRYPSQIDKSKLSTWISFESAYKMGEARKMIEQGELK